MSGEECGIWQPTKLYNKILEGYNGNEELSIILHLCFKVMNNL
jgi:hypothetical protein